MATQNSEFILIPKNLKEKDFELSGREAIDLAFLVKENIPIPSSFIISTVAFDNYLVENNLIGPIAKELKKVRPFIKQSASEAAAEIKKLIMQGTLPEELLNQLEFAYKKLSAHNENPIVTLITSHVIEEKFIPPAKFEPAEVLLQGIDDLIYQIKLGWAKLFNEEALEFRANGYYKGEISVGLIIQKLIRTEVSGLANSATPFSKDEVEVKAVYGLENSEFNDNSDSYVVEKKTYSIINRHIVPQDHMFIHDLKSDAKEKLLKVELSSNWKKNQKIDDETIIYIAKLTRKIETLFKQDVTVRWGIEAGDIFVMSLDPLIIAPVEHKIEKKIEVKHKEEKTELKKQEPDIEKLAEEVFDIVEGKEDEPIIDDIPNVDHLIEELSEEPKMDFPILKKENAPKDESVKYIDDFMFDSGLYLDISKMNSKHLSALQHFNGGFFDGTELVLNNNVLPEEHSTNQKVMINLLEKYSLDLSNASRCEIHKPLIYQLSSIGPSELQLLGIAESKYKYNLDERFIDYPESLGVEVMSIKKARQVHNARNLHVCIPTLRNLSNLEDIEKVFNASGLKRSSSMRLYAEVAIPSFIFELDRIERNRVDGIIVNYSKLLKALTFRNEIREVDHIIGLKTLELLKALAKEKNLEFIIRLNNYSPEIVEFIKKLKPQQIIFTSIPSEATLKILSHN